MRDAELADIQGNILRGYNQPRFRYAYYQVGDPAQGQRFLARLIPSITTAQPWRDGKPSWTLNVAFTIKGLHAMGLPREVLASFPFEFQQGMRERAPVLVDRGESAPENWESPWDEEGVHFWVGVSAKDDTERDLRFRWLEEQRADLPALTLIGTQDAGKLVIDGAYTPKEHFGYTDGIGNPSIAGVPGRKTAGGGKLAGKDGWQPLAPGEFILGYGDEAGEIANTPRPVRFFKNGTFMVFRKLEQRVAEFRRYAEEEGKKYPGGVDQFKAKMVGRWPDGTPVELSPDKPDPELAKDPSRNLDFRYGDDPLGARCPMGAHIRRANPRDATGFGGLLSNRHRIIRRGVMYGDWMPEGSTDDGTRGLLFIAFNASIERQFEFVQQQWMNFGNDFCLGNDRDPLIGNRGDSADHSG
jgi:Dyp-type peroxidase family